MASGQLGRRPIAGRRPPSAHRLRTIRRLPPTTVSFARTPRRSCCCSSSSSSPSSSSSVSAHRSLAGDGHGPEAVRRLWQLLLSDGAGLLGQIAGLTVFLQFLHDHRFHYVFAATGSFYVPAGGRQFAGRSVASFFFFLRKFWPLLSSDVRFADQMTTKIIEGGEVKINGKGKKVRKPRTIYSSQQLQTLQKRFVFQFPA